MQDFSELLREQAAQHPILSQLVQLLLLLAACVLVYLVVRTWLVRFVRKLVGRSRNDWDDALVRNEVFLRVVHIAPALVAYYGVRVTTLGDTLGALVQRIAVAFLVVVTALAASAFLNAVNEIYSRLPDVGHRPIKGYLGFVRIVIFLVAGLLVVATLLDRSPWIFLSGIGAMTAVLLLVFKDTILSLVASVQLTGNDMIHVGDWIEMPQYGADGDVIDVALHTVKVQNWDKTITTIPTHAFISGSFKNWRGMSSSNSRRIKRAIFIDLTSVRFLREDEIERFSNFALLRDYIPGKRSELAEHNTAPGRNPEFDADIRRLTNVGTFRAYLLAYLLNHPKIRQDRTLIVRQLDPGPQGLPLEIYCFSGDIVWANYEGIQSDIFDHFLAIAPEFGLRVFQSPTGADLARVGAAPGDAYSNGASVLRDSGESRQGE
ncbi:MAG: mechanosensitive ion channel family protein [Deltaproteobacteria bacterium]|nr:mechanosensitive ion channel family protein [Deltaproteobacteria bacterium]